MDGILYNQIQTMICEYCKQKLLSNMIKSIILLFMKKGSFLFSTYILNVCINNFVKITALLHYLKCHFYPSAINYTRDGLNIRDLSFLTIYRG